MASSSSVMRRRTAMLTTLGVTPLSSGARLGISWFLPMNTGI